MLAKVSVILPTYNRSDTILRAVNSVISQSYPNWELLIIDDGSTDDTAFIVKDLDPRIRILKQKNAGVYAARNVGLLASSGDYIAFLDSDDEWLPHFLEITTSFLNSNPDEHFVATEFFQDWGTSEVVRHDYQIIRFGHVRKARKIGSNALELPPGETDDYLRIYSQREPVGTWGQDIAKRAGYPEVFVYRGEIFDHMRWGYLNWLPVILITRAALDKVGLFRSEFRVSADFHFLAMLAASFQANMIGIPGAFKHEKTSISTELKEGHLAGGRNRYRFEVNQLHFFEELFWRANPDNAELDMIRRLHHLDAGRISLMLGERKQAIEHLREAEPVFWLAYPHKCFAYLMPSDFIAAFVYNYLFRILNKCFTAIKKIKRLYNP